MPEPIPLLGIDTSGSSGTVALARLSGDMLEILDQRELAGKSYSSQLVATLADLFHEHHVPLPEIAAIVVTKGPGSFTGVRIGLGVVKGLAEVTRLPIIAMSRLAVLAHVSGINPVLAVLDAFRGEYYAGQYHDGRCVRESLANKEQLTAATAGGLRLVACEDRVAERLAPLGPVIMPRLTATEALRSALSRFRSSHYDNAEVLDVNYLRYSDAELFARASEAAAQRV